MADALAWRAELVPLVSRLSRLTHRRYRSFPRIAEAHQALRWHAGIHGLDNDWCDAVLLLLLDDDFERVGPDEVDLAHPPA